jgi:hypothetical protein
VLLIFPKKEIIYKELITYDTLLNIKKDTIIIQKEGEITYLRDTLIITKPFISKIDTSIRNRLIKIDYSFPENNFNVNLIKTDTSKLVMKEYESQPTNKNWLLGLIGFLIGIIIGLL